jgi:hypothetical protein
MGGVNYGFIEFKIDLPAAVNVVEFYSNQHLTYTEK